MQRTCEQFLEQLPPIHPGLKAVHVESCQSTNLLARELLEAADGPEAVLVCADYQDAGRGRRGHVWHSAKGQNALFTLGVKPLKLGYTLDSRLPICCGALVQQAIRETTGIRLRCRWPNDLTAEDGRKVAGIIILNRPETLFIGVGINVNSLSSDFPPEIREKTTTLRELGGREYDKAELIKAITIQLLNHLTDKAGYRVSEMVERWLEGARLFGETITVERNGKEEKVVPLWIVPDTGELLVKEADGSESVISSADYID